jgi:hypothetical protein
VSGARPPAASICIIIEVPERGKPETTTIGGPNRIRRRNRVRTVINL